MINKMADLAISYYVHSVDIAYNIDRNFNYYLWCLIIRRIEAEGSCAMKRVSLYALTIQDPVCSELLPKIV